MSDINGFVNIIKPTGMTSSDVVIKVRKILGIKKVGHLGTLDPAASGVLPIAIGRATKFFDYFLNKDKCYTAVVQFGKLTNTLDSFGEVLDRNNFLVTEDMINKVLPEFVGEILQTPPKYSAIKINGKKAYDLARENIEFDIEPRKINIFSIELIKSISNNKFLFKVHCSAGTYIRTLFNDIANKLSTIATTEAIIRTKSGLFVIDDAVTLEELEDSKKILSIEYIFKSKKIIEVNSILAKKLINGVSLLAEQLNLDKDYSEEFFAMIDGKLIGFYKIENSRLKQIVYLF